MAHSNDFDINNIADMFDTSLDLIGTDDDDGVAVELKDPSLHTNTKMETFTPITETVEKTPIVKEVTVTGMDKAREIYANMHLANPNVRRCDVIRAMTAAGCSTEKGCGTYYQSIYSKDPTKKKK